MSTVTASSDKQATSFVGGNVAFVIYREGLGPIFSSVYLAPAERLAAQGFDVRLATMAALGEWLRPRHRQRWKKVSASVEQHLPGRLHRLPCPPNRARWAWNESRVLTRWLRRTYGRNRRVVLHCGASQATVHALEAKKSLPELRVVYQVWGPEAAEHLFDNIRRGGQQNDQQVEEQAHQRDDLQRRAMREADAIVSISAAMTRWSIDEFGADPEKIIEVPCFVDTDHFRLDEQSREATREQLGLGSRFTVVYSGSMFRWQFPDGCFEVLKAVLAKHPDAQFLAITTSPEAMRRRLQEHNFPQDAARVVSVPYAEVPQYLAAGDLAILGRGIGEGPSLVNAVSSPVKFGEYLACGVPVVLSEGVGDFSKATKQNGLGIVIPQAAERTKIHSSVHDFLDDYQQNSIMKARCREFALRELSLQVHVPRLSRLYAQLSGV